MAIGGSASAWPRRMSPPSLKPAPSDAAPDMPAMSLPTYAVVGAAAGLTGVTRLTLCVAVLVMETSGALQLIVPIMVGVFFSKLTGDGFDPG